MVLPKHQFGKRYFSEMTPEQQTFSEVITSLMRIGGKFFLAFWLLICGAMAVVALCALSGVTVPPGSKANPELWVLVLIGSLAMGVFGYFFIRLWQGALDRFRSHISVAPLKNTIVKNKVAGMAKGPRLTTTAHLGLQIVLSLIGGLVGFAIHIVLCFQKPPMPPITSGVAFLLLVGLGSSVPRLIMLLLPARCPKCSGLAYCSGSRPIIFVCRDCNNNHNTGISINSGDGNI